MSVIADFVKRRKIEPDSDVRQRVQNATKTYITQSLDDLALEDYSKFTLVIEELIKNNQPIPEKYYIAPFLLNNIVKEYKAGNYGVVEERCKDLLRQTNFDRQVLWELHYHLVLVYARTGREEFWDALKTSPLDYIDRQFLIGFYYRNRKAPSEIKNALEHFENVLSEVPNHKRARREIVNTYLLLVDYTNALKYAKENYEQNPSDILYLHSYFISLVRNENFNPMVDYKVLNALMEKAKTNLDPRANDIYQCLNAEYEYWVKKEVSNSIKILKEAINTSENPRYPLKALLIIYRQEGMFDDASEIKKNYQDYETISRFLQTRH